MSRERNGREALLAEAIGDLAHVLDRAEALLPALRQASNGIRESSADFEQRLAAFEGRMATVAEIAQGKVVQHVVQRIDQAARLAQERETQAMTAAARAIFSVEVEPAFKALNLALKQRIDALDQPRRHRAAHLVIAVVAVVAVMAGLFTVCHGWTK